MRRATWSSSLPVPTCSYLFLPTWPYLALIRRYLKVCGTYCLETSSYCVLRCVLRRATWSSSLPVPTCSYLFLPTWPYLALIRRYLKVCVETCYLVIFTTCSYLFLPVPTYLALPGPNTSLLKGVCLRRATWSSSLPVPTCSYLFLPTWPYLALIRRYLKVCV